MPRFSHYSAEVVDRRLRAEMLFIRKIDPKLEGDRTSSAWRAYQKCRKFLRRDFKVPN